MQNKLEKVQQISIVLDLVNHITTIIATKDFISKSCLAYVKA